MDDTQGAKNTEKNYDFLARKFKKWLKIENSNITYPYQIQPNLTFLLEPYFPNDYLLSSLRSQIKNWKSFLKCFSDSKFFFKAIIVRQKKVFPFQFFRMFKCFEARVVVVGHCTNDLLQNLLRPQPHLCQLVVCYRVTKIRKNG